MPNEMPLPSPLTPALMLHRLTAESGTPRRLRHRGDSVSFLRDFYRAADATGMPLRDPYSPVMRLRHAYAPAALVQARLELLDLDAWRAASGSPQ